MEGLTKVGWLASLSWTFLSRLFPGRFTIEGVFGDFGRVFAGMCAFARVFFFFCGRSLLRCGSLRCRMRHKQKLYKTKSTRWNVQNLVLCVILRKSEKDKLTNAASQHQNMSNNGCRVVLLKCFHRHHHYHTQFILYCSPHYHPYPCPSSVILTLFPSSFLSLC